MDIDEAHKFISQVQQKRSTNENREFQLFSVVYIPGALRVAVSRRLVDGVRCLTDLLEDATRFLAGDLRERLVLDLERPRLTALERERFSRFVGVSSFHTFDRLTARDFRGVLISSGFTA